MRTLHLSALRLLLLLRPVVLFKGPQWLGQLVQGLDSLRQGWQGTSLLHRSGLAACGRWLAAADREQPGCLAVMPRIHNAWCLCIFSAPSPTPNPHRALAKLYTNGGAQPLYPVCFLTNGGGVTERVKAHQLSEWLGVAVDESQAGRAQPPSAPSCLRRHPLRLRSARQTARCGEAPRRA